MPKLKAITADVLVGLGALVLFIGIAAVSSAGFDLRKLCIVDAIAFFCAGLVRSRRPQFSTSLASLLVGMPSAIVILLLSVTGSAFTDTRIALIVALLTLGMTISGMACGRLWLAGSRAKSAIAALVPVSVVLAGSVLVIPVLTASSLGRTVDIEVPRFAIAGADGSSVDSSQLKGHVVVLSFWATWCAPCRQELPQIEKLAERYRSQPDVEFWAVGGPWGDDTIELERQYARESGMRLALAFDGNRSAARAIGISAFPSVALLDKSGRLRFVHTGYDASDPFIRNLSDTIDSLRQR